MSVCVVQVHSEMAEDAYKAQAEAIAPGGNLSPEGAEELKEMAEKMGISEEKAQKIVRGVTNKRLVGNLQSLRAQGELTLDKARPALCAACCASPSTCYCAVSHLVAVHVARKEDARLRRLGVL